MNIILFEKEERFLPLSDERARHILKVLHLKKGDSFLGGIVNSLSGRVTIDSIDSDGLYLSFALDNDSSALYPVTLLCAQVRPICMRRILRESVSLGVSRIILPVSDLGEKSYLSASLYRDGEYRKILIDGAMQAGRTGVPETILADSAEQAIEISDSSISLLLDNSIGAVPLSGMDLSGRSVTLAIGPERGWSDRERKLFISSGYTPTIMGSRILRTETASVAAVALSLSRMGYL